MTEVVAPDPLQSLTAALVDANDRLLGLLALISGEAPESLVEADLVSDIVARARRILTIDYASVEGAAEHRIGEAVASPVGRWTTTLPLDGHGDLRISFERHIDRFDTGDAKMLNAVAHLVAQGIATARRHADALAQEAIAQETAAAERVINAALPNPDSKPVIDRATLFASLVSAKQVGGDLYSWRRIGDRLWFAIGDVSGKGLPAAVQMSVVCNSIDSALLVHHDKGPGAVLEQVGEWVHERLSGSAMFVTLAIGSWNATTGEVAMANAGHSPVVFCRDGSSERVDASIPPIGVIDGLAPDVTEWIAEPGDVIVMATDGCSEQVGPDGEMFGEDAFDELVIGSCGPAEGDAERVGNEMIEILERARGGVDPSDDRTLVIVGFGA